MGPATALGFEAAPWETRLRKISGEFLKHKNIVDSGVELQALADTETFVTTEGTRERFGNKRAVLVIHAEVKPMMASGSPIASSTWPTRPRRSLEAQLLAEVDELATRLGRIAAASRLKRVLGADPLRRHGGAPVVQSMVARGMAAQPAEVGRGRRAAGGDTLDKLFGKRILPASFHVWDDPRVSKHNDTYLAGNYAFDDEGLRRSSWSS